MPTRPAPVVTSVSPDSGSVSGGDTVLIYADNLNFGVGAVKFGTVAVKTADVTPHWGTAVQVVSPPGAAGKVDVTVANSFGDVSTTVGRFTYK